MMRATSRPARSASTTTCAKKSLGRGCSAGPGRRSFGSTIGGVTSVGFALSVALPGDRVLDPRHLAPRRFALSRAQICSIGSAWSAALIFLMAAGA